MSQESWREILAKDLQERNDHVPNETWEERQQIPVEPDAPVYVIRTAENKLLATVTHYQTDAPYIPITYGLPGRVYRFKCPHCECSDWREDGPGYRFECESCGESTEFIGKG